MDAVRHVIYELEQHVGPGTSGAPLPLKQFNDSDLQTPF